MFHENSQPFDLLKVGFNFHRVLTEKFCRLTVRRCLAETEGRGPFRSEPYCFLLPDTPYE